MSYGWLEGRVPLGVIIRSGLIIETLTHLALALTRWVWLALTRWVWLALVIFTIFGARAFIWGTPPRRTIALPLGATSD